MFVCDICVCRHTYKPRSPHIHLALYADDISLLTQSWQPLAISRRISHTITTLRKCFTNVETLIKFPQNYNHFIFQASSPPLPYPTKVQDTFVVMVSDLRCVCFVLNSKPLFTRHLNTVANKATGVFCNISPLLERDSALSPTNYRSLNYKL